MEYALLYAPPALSVLYIAFTLGAWWGRRCARPEPAQALADGPGYPERDEAADNDDRAAEMRARRSVRVDHAEAGLAAHFRLTAKSSDPERRAWYCN